MNESDEFDSFHDRVPFGCLITFRTYGTWLHGDQRGSIDRDHNLRGTPRIPPNPPRQAYEQRLLSRLPVFLGQRRREAVRLAVVNACEFRGWILHALNVRTNHVHLVAATDVLARTVLSMMKARATAQMRRLGCWNSDRSPWAKGGSARAIWTAQGLGRAIEYVLHGQGPDLD